MATTIKKIARDLNLNPSTISRALSGSPQVSETTRKKVLLAARRLNYMPNFWAQNLVGAASNLIGCLVLDLTNPFYIPMVRAVEDIAEKQDYIIFLSESRRQIKMEKSIIERFRRIRIAGLIITPVNIKAEHLFQLEKEGVPVIIAARNADAFDSVNVDNIKSGKLAGGYLMEHGHKKIGFIHSGDSFNIPEQNRLKGLRQSMEKANLGLNSLYTIGTNSIAGGEKAGDLWFNDPRKPSAVFCSNDLLAMGFIQKVIRLGAHVPEDISVIGHDDIPFADSFMVPLTSIVFPKYDLGRIAMQVLIERINDQKKRHVPQNVALEPQVVERSSCRVFTE